MAQIKPMALVESMSKKVCMHSDVYFRTNKQTGAVYTGKLCNPFTGEPTANQVTAKTRFAKVSKAIRERLAVTTSEETKAIKAAFKAQTKVGSVFGLAFKKWNSEYDANGDLIDTDMEDND